MNLFGASSRTWSTRSPRNDRPDPKLSAYVGKGGRASTRLEPKEARTLPSVHVDSEDAIEPIAEAIAALRDYRRDDCAFR
jgi:hypothetical protein